MLACQMCLTFDSLKVVLMCHICYKMTETREHAATKERTAQSKILGLETQLSRITTEISQLQRSKQEVKISSNF